MFCANCGKTLKNGATTCPHCGAPIGENRFHGLQYTAVQPTIAPGETEKLTEQFRPYTRTTYMSTGEPEGDVLSRTTYRPVLDEESAPQAEAESAQAEAAQDEALPGEAEPQPEATESESAGVESLFGEPKSDSSAAGFVGKLGYAAHIRLRLRIAGLAERFRQGRRGRYERHMADGHHRGYHCHQNER